MNVRLHDARNVSQALPARIERKFFIPAERVELAYGLLRTLCRPDRDFPAEQVSSLYFDTAGLDEYEHSLSGDFRKNKVRIRWYGTDGRESELATVFLELKSRRGFASTKQRLKVEVPSLKLEPAHLAAGIVSQGLLERTLAGFGFFMTQALLPVVKISYLRFRFRDPLIGQGLALDCRIRSSLVRPELGHGQRELEISGSVLEIKGHDLELPPTLKRLRLLEIDWSQFSKYSACLNAHGDRAGATGRLSPQGRDAADMPVVLREARFNGAALHGRLSPSCAQGSVSSSPDPGAV